jgi:hypothetical protein
MTAPAAIVALLVGAALVGAAWLLVAWRARHPALTHHVLVSLADEEAGLRGLVTAQHGDFLVLTAAEVCSPGEPPTRVAGDVILDRRRILWVQLLDPRTR